MRTKKVELNSLFLIVLFVSLFSLNMFSGILCEKGMATLSISVSAKDEPCKIENARTWYVTVFNCDGTVLEFCRKKYVLLPTKCGCLDVKVPPGCYYIKAVWGYKEVEPGVYKVNHFTDAAIVQACCGKTTCVRLFNPSAHRCGTIYALAVKDLIKQGAIKRDAGKRAIGVIHDINRQLPEPKYKFELGIQMEIDELFKKLENKKSK